MTDNLVWIDLETGGLCGASSSDDPRIPEGSDGSRQYAILEIAVHITDNDLNILDKGLQVVIFHTPESLEQRVGEWSQKQFANTLMIECQNPNHPSLAEAERMVLDYLVQQGIKAGISPLCGNSIYLDRRFIETQMPKLNAHLHYRQYDVSSVGEMVSRWFPRIFDRRPKKAGSHDALADIRESIEEMRFYRDHCFISTDSMAQSA